MVDGAISTDDTAIHKNKTELISECEFLFNEMAVEILLIIHIR